MLRRALAALSLIFVATGVSADTHVWTGASDSLFSNPANWIGGLPAGDPNADLSFPPGARLAAQNDIAGLTVRSLTISQGNYAISGNPITFAAGGEIIDSSTTPTPGFSGSPNLISADLILTQGLRITKLDFFANPALTLSGAISGTGDVWIKGGGAIAFAGNNANTYSGATHVFYGMLQLRKPANTNAVPGELRLESNGDAQYVSTYNDEQIADGFSVFVDVTGNLSIGGVETIAGLNLISQASVSCYVNENGVSHVGRLILGGDITHDGRYGQAWLYGDIYLPVTRTITSGPVYGIRITNGLHGNPGAGVILNGSFDLNYGTGNHWDIQGTYDGPTIVNSGRLELSNTHTTVVVQGGGIDGNVGAIDGQFGEVNGRSYLGGVISAGDIHLSPAANVVVDIDSYSTSPPIQLNGTLDLGGAQLMLPANPGTYQRQLGKVTTIISNTSATPVAGTFGGYPEGSLINNRFTLSYAGGDGNDVTVTEAGMLGSTTTVTANAYSAPVGSGVTFNAYIQTNSSVPFTPTGTVTFSAGATVLATVPVSNNAASTTVSNLPVGYDQVTATYSGDAQVTGSQGSTNINVTALPATITSIEPSTVPGATSTTLIIHGSGFIDGSSARIGEPSYVPTYPATFVSSSELDVAYNSPGVYTDSHPNVTEVQGGPCCVLSNSVQFTVTAVQPPPPSPFVFDAQNVSLPVTPGAMTAWLSVTRRFLGYTSLIEELAKTITDDDNDGMVSWHYDNGVAPVGIWVAADLTTRDLFAVQQPNAVTPQKSPFPQKAFLLDGAGNYSHIALAVPQTTEGGEWTLMWARPGVGAWTLIRSDGGAGDLDQTQNNLLVFDTSSMMPVDSSPPPPAGMAAGDLFFGIDEFAQKWFGDKVDDHLAETLGPGVIRFASQFQITVRETDGVAHVVLLRMGGTDGAVSLQYTTADGTALAGVNYTAQAGTVTFNAGENLKTIDIPLIDDSTYSGLTTFSVQLSNPAGTTIDGLTSATVGIFDNDPRPVISVQPSVTSTQEGDTGTHQIAVNINLQGSTRKPVTVNWSWNEGNNPFHNGQVIFAPGETQKTFTVSYDANTIPENNRIIGLSIGTDSEATLGTSNGSITIVDDDFATISVADASVLESAGQVYIRFVLSRPTRKPIHVMYTTSDGTATAGSDYVAKSGTVDVTTDNLVTLQIPILNDAVPEPTERFYFTMTAADGGILGRSTAIITIIDDDGGGAAGPSGLTATANGTSNIMVTWLPLAGATSYELQQSSGGNAFSPSPFFNSTSATITGLSFDTTYLFRVRALFSDGTLSAFSIIDPATTTIYADDPLNPGVTVIKAAHVADARRAVNAMRAAASLTQFTFTDNPLLPGSLLKAAHIVELRTALDQARSAIGLPPLTYTDSDLTGVPLKAIHISEIRNGCR